MQPGVIQNDQTSLHKELLQFCKRYVEDYLLANLRILNRELECNVLVGEGVVHVCEGVQLGLNVHLILRVQQNLQGLGAILLIADALSYDLSGVYDILKDSLVHGGEGARAGARSATTVLAVDALGENSTLSDNHNVTSTAKHH